MWAYCVPLLCCFCDACAAPLQLVMDAFPSFLVFKIYRRSLVHAAVSRRNQAEEQGVFLLLLLLAVLLVVLEFENGSREEELCCFSCRSVAIFGWLVLRA